MNVEIVDAPQNREKEMKREEKSEETQSSSETDHTKKMCVCVSMNEIIVFTCPRAQKTNQKFF